MRPFVTAVIALACLFASSAPDGLSKVRADAPAPGPSVRIGDRATFKLALRVVRFRHRQEAETVAAIDKCLASNDACDAMVQYVQDSMANSAVGAPGTIQDFLQWILNNQDQIIAFIKAIISLFSSSQHWVQTEGLAMQAPPECLLAMAA